MPRADDYRTAAADVRRHIESLSTMAGVLVRCSDDVGCSGTTVATSVVEGVIAATSNAGDAAEKCQTLVEELDRRAVLCDQYTRAVNTYERVTLPRYDIAGSAYDLAVERGGQADWPGRRPGPPEPPFPGAEYG